MFTQIVSHFNVVRNPAGKMIMHKVKPCAVSKESASVVKFLEFIIIIVIKADHFIIWV
jgi:hypothetical protein